MPAASAARPIKPSSASISRTRCPFPISAHRRVARHLPNRRQTMRDQGCRRAATGRGRRCFATRVSATDDDDVKGIRLNSGTAHVKPLSLALNRPIFAGLLPDTKSGEYVGQELLPPQSTSHPVHSHSRAPQSPPPRVPPHCILLHTSGASAFRAAVRRDDAAQALRQEAPPTTYPGSPAPRSPRGSDPIPSPVFADIANSLSAVEPSLRTLCRSLFVWTFRVGPEASMVELRPSSSQSVKSALATRARARRTPSASTGSSASRIPAVSTNTTG